MEISQTLDEAPVQRHIFQPHRLNCFGCAPFEFSAVVELSCTAPDPHELSTTPTRPVVPVDRLRATPAHQCTAPEVIQQWPKPLVIFKRTVQRSYSRPRYRHALAGGRWLGQVCELWGVSVERAMERARPHQSSMHCTRGNSAVARASRYLQTHRSTQLQSPPLPPCTGRQTANSAQSRCAPKSKCCTLRSDCSGLRPQTCMCVNIRSRGQS